MLSPLHAAMAATFALGVLACSVSVPDDPSSLPPSQNVSAEAIPHDFVSLAVPQHFALDYSTQDGSTPNSFTRDLLALLTDVTGVPPRIRLGGASTDRTTYDPDQQEPYKQTGVNSNGIPSNVTVNEQYLHIVWNNSTWPRGTKVTYMLPLIRNDSLAIENAVRGAQWSLAALGTERFGLWEIGNAPDQYPEQSSAPSNWGVADYVARWRATAQAVTDAVLKPWGLSESPQWMAESYALLQRSNWTTEDSFNAGMNDDGFVQEVSLHAYPASNESWVSLDGTFMSHQGVVANLSQLTDDVEYLRANDPEIKLVLSETNIDKINVGMDAYESVEGSAVWAVDWLLASAAMDVQRVYLQQGTTYAVSAWQPIAVNGSAPRVKPQWYAIMLVASAVGKDGDVTVGTLDVSNGKDEIMDKASGYGVWRDDALDKVVLINFDAYNDTSVPRPVKSFDLQLPISAKAVNTSLLTGENTNAGASKMAFGGVGWDYDAATGGAIILDKGDQGVGGTQKVVDGKVKIDVAASEAALVQVLYG